jgi:hypothetical protein
MWTVRFNTLGPGNHCRGSWVRRLWGEKKCCLYGESNLDCNGQPSCSVLVILDETSQLTSTVYERVEGVNSRLGLRGTCKYRNSRLRTWEFYTTFRIISRCVIYKHYNGVFCTCTDRAEHVMNMLITARMLVQLVSLKMFETINYPASTSILITGHTHLRPQIASTFVCACMCTKNSIIGL